MTRRGLIWAGAAVLLVPGLVSGGCVTVERQAVEIATTFEIRTELYDLPAAGSTVQMFALPNNREPVQSSITDAHGIAKISNLPSGAYRLVAMKDGKFAASLDVKVLPKSTVGTKFLSVKLERDFENLLDGRQLAALNAGPKVGPTSVFSGVVQDVSGAGVPSATIEIWKRGKPDDLAMATITADGEGKFAKSLPDGVYAAVFKSQGFARETLVFEIKAGAPVQKVDVRLKVGAC
jgi:hypothetical protein